ncbi:hypothetical protein [Planctomonas psychrotolerans]|uniref:hypothetical protein n=1 Tax=Planctomonas psychrotolerans TaxID=2528712 RepID=UPI001D0D0909|nr:hypothetical protein [Planctomonas psychrotolerans]
MLRLVQPGDEPELPNTDLEFLRDSEEFENGLRAVTHLIHVDAYERAADCESTAHD